MGSISYQYNVLMKYQEINNKLPQYLVPYCGAGATNDYPLISSFDDQLNEIISSITKGDNPNMIIFRNYVKFYVNKIHQANYQEYQTKLKALDYSTKENITYLCTELIICAIRCPISVKGFTFQEDSKYKSVPEICADLVKNFSMTFIKNDEREFGFYNEMLSLCQQYFYDFIDVNKSLDENNDNTSDNYKGFMTFMGLLYSRGIINNKIVFDCIESIKRTIFGFECNSLKHDDTGKHLCSDIIMKMTGNKKTSDNKTRICYYDCDRCDKPSETNKLMTFRKQIECTNLHKGYENIIMHVINSLDIKSHELITAIENKQKYLKKINLILHDVKKNNMTYLVTEYIKNNTELNSDENMTSDKLVNYLNNDIKSGCEFVENNANTLSKTGDYVNMLVLSHQDFIRLNNCYNAINKNQICMPFKSYVLMSHNNVGSQLNKLIDRLSIYNKKQLCKYKSVQIGKS